MSKVLIEIEDMPGDKVAIKMSPTFETMMKKNESGFPLTSGEAYAIAAINTIRKESKHNESTQILIPRIGR